MPKTISSAIEWWAKVTPAVPAVSVGGVRLSFKEFDQWVSAVAADLYSKGLRPGDRVAALGNHSLAYCALVFATIRAGGVIVPLGARLTSHELRGQIDDVRPRLAFADSEHLEKLAEAGAETLSLDGLVELQGQQVSFSAAADPKAPAVIIFTSGSTAKPKGVVLSNESLLAGATQYSMEDSACSAGGRKLIVAPMSVSAGAVQLIIFVSLGCTIFLESKFDAKRALEILSSEKITLFAGAPIFLERIAAEPDFETADLSSISYAYTGGARVSTHVLKLWHEKGVEFRQMYGITECGGMATIMPRGLGTKSPEKCGFGRIFNKIKIVNENGEEAPPGEEGEIVLQTPDMMQGYWMNPEATADALRNGWLYTGDIGVKDEDGMLTFVDRKKDLIVSGGLKISAAEVEHVISELPEIEEVAVIGVFDPRFSETALAVIYSESEISIPKLIEFCEERLADYKVPRYVVQAAAPLPRLAAGKISKPALREQYCDAPNTLAKVR